MKLTINPDISANEEGFSPNVDNRKQKLSLEPWQKGIWILLWLLIIPLLYHLVKGNQLRRQMLAINNTASTIDVVLKRRKDTLSKLVEATKSYVKYEGETLMAITKARQMNLNQVSRVEADSTLTSAFGRLLAVAENYPNLKVNELAQQTISQASYLEAELSASRRLYNTNVTTFNQLIFSFPSSIVASWQGLAKMPLFVATATDKEDVSLNF